jgi:hypothetical protein
MIILHIDKAKPPRWKVIVQEMAELRMTSVPHSPLSPDIAVSDFSRFGYRKTSVGKGRTTTRKDYFERPQRFYVGFVLTYRRGHLPNG